MRGTSTLKADFIEDINIEGGMAVTSKAYVELGAHAVAVTGVEQVMM